MPPVRRIRRRLYVEHKWSPPVLGIYGGQGERPDMWLLSGVGLVVMTVEVATALMPYVSMAGELLPLRASTGEEEKFLALNILNVVDAIDMKRSSARDGLIFPDFVAHRLGEATLFVVPQLEDLVFCIERDDVDDSLMRRMSAHEFTGIIFDHMWSSESGARDLNLMLN